MAKIRKWKKNKGILNVELKENVKEFSRTSAAVSTLAIKTLLQSQNINVDEIILK